MKRLLVILTLLTFSVSLVNAQDQTLTSNDPPYYCPNKNGAFYQPNLFPRYDINTHSLVLIDATTNQSVRTLDTIKDEVRIVNWSPDCLYITGIVGRIGYVAKYSSIDLVYVLWEQKITVFWDTINGGRTQTFPNLSLGQYTSLGQTYYDYWRNRNRSWFNEYYWDMERGWLWGSGIGGVSAYDVNSGEEVRFFQNGSWTESRFAFSADNTKVITYSMEQPGGSLLGAITIYDIDNQDSVSVNVEGFAAPEIPLADYHPVALSADNRYLAVGYDAIRVWDIQNLPEKFEDRLPIYRHAGPKALIWSLRFSDWGVIETNSKEGIQHWDLHTGAFIPS